MGGRLWVESEPGQGSTFYFAVSLPVASESHPPLAAPASAAATTGPAPAAGLAREPSPVDRPEFALHALVVDDEEYNRLALSAFLEQAGFQVTAAGDAEAALAAARRRPFHAVFLDVNLPGQSGPDIARALRALPGVSPTLPIVATTAYTTEEKRAQCLAAGMNAFLTKPVSREKIRAALTAATSAFSAAAPLHLPGGPDASTDPLAALRLLASRKGVPFAAELARYFAELESEAGLLAEALRTRDAASTARLAHKLAGRLGFVHAGATPARELEAAAINESWDTADAAGRQLTQQLVSLREQFKGEN